MDITKFLKTNSIVVCEKHCQDTLLKLFSKNKLLVNIKLLTLDEFNNNYFFSYNEDTIYYLIKKYNYDFEYTLDILNNLKYVEDIYYENENLQLLKDIKLDLLQNNKLIINKYFINYIQDKNIFFYNYDYIDTFNRNLINKMNNVSIINEKYISNTHEVYEFNTIEEEVEFVANEICKLIKSDISINDIKLLNVSKTYNNIIKRIFSFYKIPILLNENNNLYGTIIGKEFIKNMNNGISYSINYIKKKYISNSIVNQIIQIVNKYYYLGEDEIVKKLILIELKNTNIKKNTLENKVECINYYNNINDNLFVFALGFNSDSFMPLDNKISIIGEEERKILNIESRNYLIKLNKENLIKNINNIKNLTITYSLFDNKKICYPSNLINELNVKLTKPNVNLTYSNMNNKLELASLLDDYYKYNILDDKLTLLYSNYSIPYLKYNNEFTKLNLIDYKKYIENKKMILSYTNIDKYNKCAFSYYLSHILKLDNFENTLSSIVGTLLHDMLDNYYKNENQKQSENILKYNLKPSELFYIDKLIEYFKIIMPSIINQTKNMKFNNFITEEKIEINLNNNFNLIGFIDKIMTYDNNLKKYGVIIDYKTYETNLDLSLIKYGLNLQLPIYYYLVKEKYKDIKIIGMYYQNILPNILKYDIKSNYEDRIKESIKLNGITIDDNLLIELIDKDYVNSKVIKGMKVKNDGKFYSTSKIITNEKLDKLYCDVKNIINQNLLDIENAKFDINPKLYKEKNISCEYCKFKDICFKSDKNFVNLKEGEETNDYMD